MPSRPVPYKARPAEPPISDLVTSRLIELLETKLDRDVLRQAQMERARVNQSPLR